MKSGIWPNIITASCQSSCSEIHCSSICCSDVYFNSWPSITWRVMILLKRTNQMREVCKRRSSILTSAIIFGSLYDVWENNWSLNFGGPKICIHHQLNKNKEVDLQREDDVLRSTNFSILISIKQIPASSFLLNSLFYASVSSFILQPWSESTFPLVLSWLKSLGFFQYHLLKSNYSVWHLSDA